MTQFRYQRTVNASYTGNYNTVWDDKIFDPDGVVSGATFTVPASWNGKYMCLYYCHRTTANISGFLGLQYKPSGGAWQLLNYSEMTASPGDHIGSGVLLANTGDQYRTYAGGSATVLGSVRHSFSGHLLGEDWHVHEAFKASAASTQSVSDTVLTRMTTLTNIEFDDTGDVSGSVFIVPPELDGGFGVFTASVLSTSSSEESIAIFAIVSTDDGASYPTANSYGQGDITDGVACIASTGVVRLKEGERWGAVVYNVTTGMTIKADSISSLSGFVWIPRRTPTLIANYNLRRDGTNFNAGNGVYLAIDYENIIEDPSGLLSSGATTITAPEGAVYAIASAQTRNNSVGAGYNSLEIRKNGTSIGRQGIHNSDYATLLVSSLCTCSEGDTFQSLIIADSASTNVQQDTKFSVAFYG